MRMRKSLIFVVCLVFVATLAGLPAAVGAEGDWVKPPTTQQMEANPLLQHHVLDSRLMGRRVGYCVSLPRGYEDDDRRYPVVYWLHGGGANESTNLSLALRWQEMERSDGVQPAILVLPNGQRGGYMDHADGKTLAESFIIQELIPEIDRRYRTIATPQGRALHGFSMGAEGALKLAIKYPELFGSAVAYGGGAIDLEKSQDPMVLDSLRKNLASDPARIRANNTWRMLSDNRQKLAEGGTRILLIAGDDDRWYDTAVAFHVELQRQGVPARLITARGVAHDIRGLFQAHARDAILFQGEQFDRAAPTTRPAATESP